MKRRRNLCLAGAALLSAALLLAHEPLLLAIGDYLVVQDALQPADLIHVIAGHDGRTDHAIRLYLQGYGKRLFFTGGWCPAIQGEHGERGRAHALEQGVPAGAIATDDTAVTSTYAEVLRLQAYIAASPEPVRSVIVVSDPFHMRRVQWACRQVLGPAVRAQMAPIPFELTSYRRRWWADASSRRYVWREYGKLAYYYARYGLGWRPLSDWLASFDWE